MKKISVITAIFIAILFASCSPQTEEPVEMQPAVITPPVNLYEYDYKSAPFSSHNKITGELKNVTELTTQWFEKDWTAGDGGLIEDFVYSLATPSSDTSLLYVFSRKTGTEECRLYVYLRLNDPNFVPYQNDPVEQEKFFYYACQDGYDYRTYNTVTPVLAYSFNISKGDNDAYAYIIKGNYDYNEEDRVIVSSTYYIENAKELDVTTLEVKSNYDALNGAFYMVYDPEKDELVFPIEVYNYNTVDNNALKPDFLQNENANKEELQADEGWESNVKISSIIGFFNGENYPVSEINSYLGLVSDLEDEEGFDPWKISKRRSCQIGREYRIK